MREISVFCASQNVLLLFLEIFVVYNILDNFQTGFTFMISFKIVSGFCFLLLITKIKVTVGKLLMNNYDVNKNLCSPKIIYGASYTFKVN